MTFRRTALMALTVAAILLIISVDRAGCAVGLEWSPTRFEHRSFRYVVFFHVQITPQWTSDRRSDLENYLHENGFVPAHDRETNDWEFMSGSAPGVRGWNGEARFINSILGDESWVEWSVKNPELAKVLWPEFVSRAQAKQFRRLRVAFSEYGEELRTAKNAEEIREIFRKADENMPD